MNFRKQMIWLACIPLLLFTGCGLIGSDNICDKEELLPFETPVSERVSCLLQNINENETEISLIIDNRVDLEKYVRCNASIPDIDFEKSIILAGRTKLYACGKLKDQNVALKCSKIEYHIKIEKIDCHKPTDVFYFAILPVAYMEYPVDFIVTKDQ